MNVCDNCKGNGRILNTNKKKLMFKKKGYSNYKVPELEDSKIIRSDFSKILKDERERKDLTQKELASRMGVKENIIHKLETGHMHPTDNMIKKLKKFFDVSFYEEKKEKKENNEGNEKVVRSESGEGFVLGDFIKKR